MTPCRVYDRLLVTSAMKTVQLYLWMRKTTHLKVELTKVRYHVRYRLYQVFFSSNSIFSMLQFKELGY